MTRNFENWATISGILAHFLWRMRRNGHKTTFGQICNPKFETSTGCFLFDYVFWWRLLQDLCVFWAKNGFRNAKFSDFGGWWGWGWPFLTKPQKAHPCLISRVLSNYACRSVHGFFLQTSGRKRDTTKSQRGYISPICGEFPTQPNFTKIGVWVWVANIIKHTKFGRPNDRSREYKVTEGRILACSIGMACRL